MEITPERKKKYIQLANRRQPDLAVILENVVDWHNVGAVMRSCDAVGIGDLYVVYSWPDCRPVPEKGDYSNLLGKRTAAGTRKWVQVHYFEDLDLCLDTVRKKHRRILTSSLKDRDTDRSFPLYDLDLTTSVALLFGNEHDGVSDEAVEKADGNFIIPQKGIVESLNISVACAVSLFEAMRQRILSGKYSESEILEEQAVPYYERYLTVHREKWSRLPVVVRRWGKE